MRNAIAKLVLLVLTAMASMCHAGSTGTPAVVPVDGILGLRPVGASAYLAVYVPLQAGQALSGLRWYNNDAQAVFPRLLLASGEVGEPAPASAAAPVLEGVQGVSSGWSELTLPEPVMSASAGLYALFQLPSGSECQAEGLGGGAGIGYSSQGGLAAWLTADGENWAGLRQGFGLAVQPIVVTAAEGMQVMSRRVAAEEAVALPQVATLLPSGPNPFNPRTQLCFSLPQAERVTVTIYNARGEVVRRLADESFAAGDHAIAWDGRDNRGAGVASGPYIARVAAGRIVMTKRLTLVR